MQTSLLARWQARQGQPRHLFINVMMLISQLPAGVLCDTPNDYLCVRNWGIIIKVIEILEQPCYDIDMDVTE